MTYGQLRSRLLEMAPGTSLNLLDGWIQGRLTRVLDEMTWERLDQVTTLAVPVEYNTGTVGVTAGSTAVVGTGTAWTAAMTGRMFRVPGEAVFYTFTYASPTSGVLDRAYEGTTNATASYRINQAVFSFGPEVRLVNGLVSFTGEFPVARMSREDLDRTDPARTSYGGPASWTPSFDLLSDPPEVTIELNPVPTLAQTFKVMVSVEALPLSGSSNILLPWVRPQVLVEGVMADIRRWQKDAVMSREHEALFQDLKNQIVAVAAEAMGPTDMRMSDRFTRRRRARAAREGC